MSASEPGRGSRLFVLDLAGGAPRAITPEGVTIISSQIVSPDGRFIVARSPDGRHAIYPTTTGEPRIVPNMSPDELPIRWSADGRALFVERRAAPPGVIDVVDVETGRRTTWKKFQPLDVTGSIRSAPR